MMAICVSQLIMTKLKYIGFFKEIKILSETYVTIFAFHTDKARTRVHTSPVLGTLNMFTARLRDLEFTKRVLD